MDIDSPLERRADEELRKAKSTDFTIPFEITMADSPKARSYIFAAELQIDELTTWVENSQRLSKNFCAQADKYFDSQIKFTKQLSENLASDQLLHKEVFNVFQQIWTNMEKHHRRLNVDLKNNILGAFNKILEEDIKNIKEEKKKVDKLSEKYSVALAKFSQVSTRKEATILEEEAFQLYEARLNFINASLDHVAMLRRFDAGMELLFASKFLDYVESEMMFYRKANEVFLEMQPRVAELRAQYDKKKEEFAQKTSQIDTQLIQMKEQAANIYKPVRLNEADQEVTNHRRNSKEGYLWKKLRQGISRWDRRYFTLHNQTLSYRSFSPERALRGVVVTNNIGTCIIHPTPTEKTDRRFCFEIETNTKQQWVFQTESEAEYRDWLTTLENAKAIHCSEEPSEDKEGKGADDSSSRKISVVPTPETLRYPKEIYAQKNAQLHVLLKSIPSTDYVFDSCSCKWLKEVPIHGKIYVTQNRLVFYFSIVKITRVQVIYIPEIIAIETNKKDGVLQKNLEIQTASNKYVFSFRKPRHFDLREVLIKIWMWHKDHKEKLEIPTSKVQEFYDSLYKNYIQDPKEDESDGSDTEDDSGDLDTTSTLETIATPPDFNFPAAEVPGEAEPYPELLLNEVFPISVQRLHSTLFDAEDPIFVKYLQKRNYQNYKPEAWTTNADGKLQRTVEYMTPINVPMHKAPFTETFETQIYTKKEDFLRYVIEIHTSTPNAPYGDFFETQLRYILTYVSKTSSRLHLSANVEFKKSTAFKGMIQKGVYGGVRGMANDIKEVLKKETRTQKAAKGSVDQTDLDEQEGEKSGDTAAGKSSVLDRVTSVIPLPSLIVILVLVLSLFLNMYFFFARPAAPAQVVATNTSSPSTGFNTDLSRIIDLENDMITWSSIEQRLQEKSYIQMRNDLKDMKKDVVLLFHTLTDVEERLMQAQVVNYLVDKVNDCQTKRAMKWNPNDPIGPEEEACLRIEFLLRDFFQKEIEKEPPSFNVTLIDIPISDS